MKKKITVVYLFCLLSFFIYPCSAANTFTNPGFESGITGWTTVSTGTGTGAVDVDAWTERNDTKSLRLYSYAAAAGKSYTASASQSIDIDASTLIFSIYNSDQSSPNTDTSRFRLYIDSDILLEYNDDNANFRQVSVDVSDYQGNHVVKFESYSYTSVSAMASYLAYIDNVYLASSYTPPPLSISSYSPSSNPTSYYETSQAFSVTLNQTANNTWYVDNVLRKTENSVLTTTYSNSTAPVGSHAVMCNSTNANGSTSRSWTWTVKEIPGLTVALLDESTGDRITPSSVRLYNTTFTRNGEINESTQSAFINYLNMSDGEYILSGSADGYYSAHGSINLTLATDTEAYMYLVSSDENASSTGLYQRFRLIDNTNTYTLSDCQIRIDKAYDSGTATVYESYFDYQGYTASWLTSTDMYIMYIICPDRTISYGYLAPDPDGLIEIVISDTLPELWDGWLNYEITADNSTETISISYQSQKTLSSAQMWVYYAENETQAYYTNSTSTNGSLYYTGDNSVIYRVRFLATATGGDTKEVIQLISWTSDGIQPERLPLLPADAPDWLKNFVSAGLIILTVLIFGAIRYDIACIIGTLVAAFLWYTGNIKIEGAVIAACAIIAVAAYMHRSRRE